MFNSITSDAIDPQGLMLRLSMKRNKPIQTMSKISKNDAYHSQLVLHFGENFIKILPKNNKITDVFIHMFLHFCE